MKTPLKLVIVAALAVTVVAAVLSSRTRQAPAETNAVPVPAATARQHRLTRPPPVANAKLPRLVDLGADKCIPCKMMAPILEELKKEYAGRMNVEFIDVWENPDAGKHYGIEVIPTQIFYDADGKELFRHVGFFAREDILKQVEGTWGGALTGQVIAGPWNNSSPP